MIGVDIVKISRIEDIIKKNGEKFLCRWFNKVEIEEGRNNIQKIEFGYFAKRFAAKEAYFKANGGEIKLKFSALCVKNNEYGKPILFYNNIKLENVEISLSDDGDYAIAFVIIK